jgi:peptide/nickel transport system permease protein
MMENENKQLQGPASGADPSASAPRPTAERGAALPGLTAPAPDSTERHADQPIEELQPTPMGQLVAMPVVAPAAAPAATAPRRRLGGLRTLLGSPKARLGVSIVLFFVLVAILAPLIAPGDPNEFVGRANQPPSSNYIFGTDSQGKDVFARTVWGARSSLLIGFGTALVTMTIATVVGMTAGYFRGRVDDVLTVVMNLFLVIPGLPLLIVLSGYLNPGPLTVILALAFTGWAFGARVSRSQTLSLREKDFVSAAMVSGQSSFGIIFGQIFPNMINIIVGGFVGSVTYGITASTALAFLGLTSVNEVTWGTNLFWAQNGAAILRGTWWTFVPSGMCVALVAFGLSLINYGMDEVTNPRLRAEREVSAVTSKEGIKRIRATPVVTRAH